MNTKTASSPEAPVIMYFTWHHIPEDLTLNRAELPIDHTKKKLRYSPASLPSCKHGGFSVQM